MSNRNKRFTVYDAMEANGVFDSNPANPGARGKDGENLYEGPVAYPQMFYHPKGETRVSNPGEIIVTPLGPQVVGRQLELVTAIARTKIEAETLRNNGWHDHPAKAIAAAGGVAPPVSPDQKIKDLEAEIKRLQAQSADAKAEKQAEMVASNVKQAVATKVAIKTALEAENG